MMTAGIRKESMAGGKVGDDRIVPDFMQSSSTNGRQAGKRRRRVMADREEDGKIIRRTRSWIDTTPGTRDQAPVVIALN
jgi:hypothetical protein